MKLLILAVALAAMGPVIYLFLAVKQTGSPPPAPGTANVPTQQKALASMITRTAPVSMTVPERGPAARRFENKNAGSPEVKTAVDHAGSGDAPTGKEIGDHLATSFDGDHAVASSQDMTQSLASGVLAVLPTGSSVRSVECRSLLCRIETVHRSLDEFRAFVHRAFLTRDTKVSNGPVFVGLLKELAQGERVVAVAYVGREGTALPMPPSVADRP